jgi:hypothetical protein
MLAKISRYVASGWFRGCLLLVSKIDLCLTSSYIRFLGHTFALVFIPIKCDFFVFFNLKAGLSEKNLNLMPCLRTLSNVLF